MKLPFLSALKVDPKSLIQKMSVLGAVYLLFLIPSFFLFFSIANRLDDYEALESELGYLGVRMQSVKELQKDRSAFLKQYGEVDPYYIDHALESMVFLESEVKALELVHSHPAFDSCDNVKSRLIQLTEGGNQFIFSKGASKKGKGLEEVELKQLRPVEINNRDLKKILVAVEGIPINDQPLPYGRPQFIIRRFNLKKKKLAERETYLLEMQLIKRGLLK